MSVNLLAEYQTRHTIDKEHKVSEEELMSCEDEGYFLLREVLGVTFDKNLRAKKLFQAHVPIFFGKTFAPLKFKM